MLTKSQIVIKNEAATSLRFANFIIDYIIITFISVFFFVFLGIILTLITGNEELLSALIDSKAWSYLLSAFVFVMYYFLMEKFVQGRTVGKLVTGTKVVTDAGDEPSTGDLLRRSLSRLIPFEPLSFFSKDGKWHDNWTDTVVVNKKAFENDMQTAQNEIDIEKIGTNN